MTDPHDDSPSPSASASKPESQLLDEALMQTYEMVELLGGEWLDTGVPPRVFDPRNRTGWALGACDVSSALAQFTIHVQQLAGPETDLDPDAMTEKVRASWEGFGSQIRQIGPATADADGLRSINVALHNNSGLSFSASTKAMDILVYSECVSWD